MAIQGSALAAMLAALTAAAAQEAAAARERREVEVAAWEVAAVCKGRVAQEAVVNKELEVKVLEQAPAGEKARQEAEMKVESNTMKREAIKTVDGR